MATVQLADVYEPTTFNQSVQEAATERNAFVASGVLVEDAQVTAMANIGGVTGDLPFYLGMTNDEPNYSTDNPAVTSTPAKITDAKMIFRKTNMNKSWSTMDLSRELALADPLQAITNRVGHYWATTVSRRLIQSAVGVLADNVANDSSDMLNDIATDGAGAIADAERISGEAVIDAAGTLGDALEELGVIAMHSVVYQRLLKQDLISFIKPSEGAKSIPMYQGYRVVYDDALPAAAGANRITYTTVLFKPGSFSWGRGVPAVPSEVERKPDSGNGGGEEILYSRRTDIIHPLGFAFDDAGIAGQSPTEAELAAAAQWDRVYGDRKNIGLAFLKTNG